MSRKFAACRQGYRWWMIASAGWFLLPTARVQAHSTFPGLGEYGSGFLHPLTTPSHLLVLLALGLWLGQQRPLRLKEPAAVVALAGALGLAIAATWHLGVLPPAFLIGVGLCVGVGVAMAGPTPFWVKLGMCGIAVLLLGMDSGADPGTPPASVFKILVATWVSLVLCLVNIAFYVSLLPAARPAQIGVRIAGSWIVAIAFLLLAFALRR